MQAAAKITIVRTFTIVVGTSPHERAFLTEKVPQTNFCEQTGTFLAAAGNTFDTSIASRLMSNSMRYDAMA